MPIPRVGHSHQLIVDFFFRITRSLLLVDHVEVGLRISRNACCQRDQGHKNREN
jgi:hypothetical protein